MGITNWVTAEDVELLYLDKDNLKEVNNTKADNFRNLLEIAYQNKLGFIIGVDMNENILELLPSYKLIESKRWQDMKNDGLLFKR